MVNITKPETFKGIYDEMVLFAPLKYGKRVGSYYNKSVYLKKILSPVIEFVLEEIKNLPDKSNEDIIKELKETASLKNVLIDIKDFDDNGLIHVNLLTAAYRPNSDRASSKTVIYYSKKYVKKGSIKNTRSLFSPFCSIGNKDYFISQLKSCLLSSDFTYCIHSSVNLASILRTPVELKQGYGVSSLSACFNQNDPVSTYSPLSFDYFLDQFYSFNKLIETSWDEFE